MQGDPGESTADRPARGDLGARSHLRRRTSPTGDDRSAFRSTLAAARLGLPWALERLHRSLARPVAAYLRTQGAEDPESLANDVLLRVLTNLERFDGDEGRFRSWAFTIAHHRLIDHRRQAARRPAATLLDSGVAEVAGGDAEQEALDQVDVHDIRLLLDRLSPDQRDVLVLRVVADLSVEQTAGVLGKTSGAVKALQRRGIAGLQRMLTERAP